MKIEDLISILYRGILDREPDASGLAHWSKILESGATMQSIAEAIASSDEANLLNNKKAKNKELNDNFLQIIASKLEAKINILDIGAQNIENQSHVYQPLLQYGLIDKIVGFEPIKEKADERNTNEPLAQIHSYALGNGKPATFYINNYDATSSMYPINDAVMGEIQGLNHLSTVNTKVIETKCLDEIKTPKEIDFLKIDVQGYELEILKKSVQTLKKVSILYSEVEFQPIYLNQPLFGDVFNYLLRNNFDLYDLKNQQKLSSVNAANSLIPCSATKLFWADALFSKRIPVFTGSQLLKSAIIAHLVFQFYDLTHDLLYAYDAIYKTCLRYDYLEVIN